MKGGWMIVQHCLTEIDEQTVRQNSRQAIQTGKRTDQQTNEVAYSRLRSHIKSSELYKYVLLQQDLDPRAVFL